MNTYNTELQGTWIPSELLGALLTPADVHGAHLSFSPAGADLTLGGSDGCNWLSGTVHVDQSGAFRVTPPGIATTLMACPHMLAFGTMLSQARYVALGPTYTLNTLRFFNAEHQPLGLFHLKTKDVARTGMP